MCIRDRLEDAHRVAPAIGLVWPPPREWVEPEGEDGRWKLDVCAAAIRAGDAPDVLERAVVLGCPLVVRGRSRRFRQGCWLLAVEHGRLAVMAWLRERNADECFWFNGTCEVAAEHGQLAALRWLRAPERAGGPCPWNAETSRFAAVGGHLGVLQWARAQDPPCPWDEGTCSCLLYTSPSPRDKRQSRMPSSA